MKKIPHFLIKNPYFLIIKKTFFNESLRGRFFSKQPIPGKSELRVFWMLWEAPESRAASFTHPGLPDTSVNVTPSQWQINGLAAINYPCGSCLKQTRGANQRELSAP